MKRADDLGFRLRSQRPSLARDASIALRQPRSPGARARHGVARFVLAVALTLPAARAGAVTVQVVPSDTTVCIYQESELRVATDLSSDLKGFELVFTVDRAKLQFLGAAAGEVLTGTGRAFTDYCTLSHSATADTISYDAAMLAGSTAGPGVLVYFRFRAIQGGESPVRCQLVDFRDSDNVRTLPDCLSGLVRIATATRTQWVDWGRVKALYR